MPKAIKAGDLVSQRNIRNGLIGIVLHVQYGRSEMPKNEPDFLYEYALVQWLGGQKSTIKVTLLEKIS
tara:strand:+ start:481 stop:684 length:204 start_codon:yes stop_codon:yes gene_type:complete